MRMCLVMHCPMVLWWGCSLGALSLLFLCGVPQNVAAGPVGCVALQMLFVVHSLAMAASHHSTRAVYFAAITIFKAQAATIEVTASSGGVGGTEPTYQFSDLSGTPVATLIGNVSNGDITASGDLKTGSGDSVSAMAAEIKALKANYAALAAKIALLESIFLSPPATPPMLSPPKPPPTTPPFTGMETCYLGECQDASGNNFDRTDKAGGTLLQAKFICSLDSLCIGVFFVSSGSGHMFNVYNNNAYPSTYAPGWLGGTTFHTGEHAGTTPITQGDSNPIITCCRK